MGVWSRRAVLRLLRIRGRQGILGRLRRIRLRVCPRSSRTADVEARFAWSVSFVVLWGVPIRQGRHGGVCVLVERTYEKNE